MFGLRVEKNVKIRGVSQMYAEIMHYKGAKVICGVIFRLLHIQYLCTLVKKNNMKKILLSVVVFSAIIALASCGASRGVGCPSHVTNTLTIKHVS